MSDNENQDEPYLTNRPRRGRTWWRKLIRIATAVALGLICAYVTLPWWAPKDMIRRHIERDLREQTALPVEIGSLSLSWSGGVRIGELTFASPEGFITSEPMLRVKRLACDFSPLRFLLRGHVEWMELEGLEVTVQVDRQGRANIAPLGKITPTFDVGRVSLRQSSLTVRLPDNDQPIVLRVSDVQFVSGRLEKLGHITMAADLLQHGAAAPMSMRLAADGGDENEVATACFHFANIDLSQLPLCRALLGDVPIRSLRGRCRGRLVFGVNANLEVKQFGLELLARNLEVHPVDAAPLPVIDEAGLRISAAIDAFSRRADIQSFRVRLPGIDLGGSASGYVDVLYGDWQGLRNLDIEGVIHPQRVSVMLSGSETLPNDLVVRGPVRLNVSAARNGEQFDVKLNVQADDAFIGLASRTLKPGGRNLGLELEGSLRQQQKAWQLNVEQGRLALGGNTITGRGRISDLMNPAATSATQPTKGLEAILAALRTVRMRGTARICDLLSLPVWGASRRQPLVLDGVLLGPWSIEGGRTTQISASLRADEKTALAVENVFVKPPGREISLDIAATIEREKMRLKDVLVDLSTDGGRISIDEAGIELGDGDEPLKITGQFEFDGIENLLQYLPSISKRQSPLAGAAGGRFRFSLVQQGRAMLGGVDADLKGLAVRAEPYFVKPPGEQASAKLRFRGSNIDGHTRWTLDGAIRGPHANIETDCRVVFAPAGTQTDLKIKAVIPRAAWLQQSCPALAKSLRGGRLDGELAVLLEAHRADCKTTFDIQGRCPQLDCLVGVRDGLFRIRRRPVAVRVTGTLDESKNGASATIELNNSELKISRSSLRIPQLRARLRRVIAAAPRQKRWPIQALEQLVAKIELSADADELLGEMIPPAAKFAAEHGLGGEMTSTGELAITDAGITFKLHADAGRAGLKSFRGFSKPADIPARFSIEAVAPVDLAAVHVRRLAGRVGEISFHADGRADLNLDAAGLPCSVESAGGHLKISTLDASTLAVLAPACKPYAPGGSAEAELHWTAAARKAGSGTIDTLALQMQNVRGRYRNKNCRASGKIVLENVELADGILQSLGRVRTDDLEFHAGKNHGWLLADMKGISLDSGISGGTFHVLFQYVDDKDLADWLSPPAAKPTTGELTEKEILALEADADATIARMRNFLKSAQIRGRVSAENFRTYDAKVKQHYLAQKLELTAVADSGKLKIEYDAGLNGGCIRERLGTNLKDDHPRMESETEIAGALSTPEIQPQIMLYFPGNTVSGLFWRTETVSCPLRRTIANAMDGRYRIRPVGKAKMTATDGVLVGRAAPRFVTNIFPGLNLTKYPYKKMTAFTSFLPDGSAENETFFFGDYDLYMEGTTDASNNIQYGLGMVMLGSAFTPEALRDWKQGRVPLIKVRGRIENGILVDDDVSYPLPNETLFEVFLKNNLAYRAWVNLHKHHPPPPSAPR